jgi:hypothetical protein
VTFASFAIPNRNPSAAERRNGQTIAPGVSAGILPGFQRILCIGAVIS